MPADSYETRYLIFKQSHFQEKSDKIIWNVISKAKDEIVGQVKWLGRWDKYAFFPREDTIWNADCLHELAEMCDAFTESYYHL